MNFAQALRAARKAKGKGKDKVSQREMAKMLGVSAGTYGDWESGARHKASLDYIDIIAKVCGEDVARTLVAQTVGKKAARFR